MKIIKNQRFFVNLHDIVFLSSQDLKYNTIDTNVERSLQT